MQVLVICFTLTSLVVGFPRNGGTHENFIQETRQQTDSLKVMLSKLSEEPKAQVYIKRVMEASQCLNDLEEAMSMIETGTELLENAEPQLLELVKTGKITRRK